MRRHRVVEVRGIKLVADLIVAGRLDFFVRLVIFFGSLGMPPLNWLVSKTQPAICNPPIGCVCYFRKR